MKLTTAHQAQLVGFDVTVAAQNVDLSTMIKMLTTVAKKWVFQREKGFFSGFDHFQVRLKLKRKQRAATVASAIRSHLQLSEICVVVTPTSEGIHKANDFNYVMKKDLTFVEGPWTDADGTVLECAPETLSFVLAPWETEILEIIKGDPDPRKVYIYLNTEGKAGKSGFCRYCGTRKIAQQIPATLRTAEDILQMVMCKPPHRAYLIDLARTARHTSSLYEAIEGIKNGYVYDKRNSFRDRFFPIPHLFVFCNSPPNLNLLSKDRWIIKTL